MTLVAKSFGSKCAPSEKFGPALTKSGYRICSPVVQVQGRRSAEVEAVWEEDKQASRDRQVGRCQRGGDEEQLGVHVDPDGGRLRQDLGRRRAWCDRQGLLRGLSAQGKTAQCEGGQPEADYGEQG